MKTKTKALVLSLCAVLLVAVSVFTTIAYLQSRDEVNNTFTVGKVKITLDEAKVDQYGVKENDTRVKENAYKLIPGHKYTKDPTVHFEEGSEASYLFVKVENGLAAIEDVTKIADQITTNGWTVLNSETEPGVYYKSVPANDTDAAKDYVVFNTFKLKTDADVENYGNATIKVTAYAIQADGFDDATAAWAAVTKVTE